MASCSCLRWMVNIRQAVDCEKLERQLRKAVQCIQNEEAERIDKFRYKDDALAAVTGRLLLRHATTMITGTSWKDVKFARTDKNKPYLILPDNTNFGLNVSHQGDFVTLAGSCNSEIGVDVMRIVAEREKTADEYITSMKRSFSSEELRVMRFQPTDTMKLTYFYRFWCLKESVIKATGIGMHKNLSDLDFRVKIDDRYRPDKNITSTELVEDGTLRDDWVFEESFLDKTHCVAVCRKKAIPDHCRLNNGSGFLTFERLDLENLLQNAEILTPSMYDGVVEWNNFDAKPWKPF